VDQFAAFGGSVLTQAHQNCAVRVDLGPFMGARKSKVLHGGKTSNLATTGKHRPGRIKILGKEISNIHFSHGDTEGTEERQKPIRT
jgi:hypothetical protein